jgi:crotonobetainyl-CoA:carnitine CoA-transferase CaiB-like acyl-CoA transferase
VTDESLASSTKGMDRPLPLRGIRVVEFTHMVMGPTCGLILGDMGADVIKVEPLAGDNTRRLLGSGAGFYGLFNRNKRSIAVDVKDPRGREIILKLISTADVFSENFKPGVMERLGLGPQALRKLVPTLICVSHKGFLPGPYDHRTALDEVVQMMGGLAYMTGRVGDPLRAGTSVNDIMGGMFGAIGVLAALYERDRRDGGSGLGHEVQSALFENNVFLVAQHMMQLAVTGQPAAPMPNRISAWGVYDVFTVQGGEQIFLSAVSDTQWAILCDEFAWTDLRDDPRLASNNARVLARGWLIPMLREKVASLSAVELARRFEARGLPFAPITKPEQLFDDPHLLQTGGLTPTTVPADGSVAKREVHTHTALLPLTLDGERLRVRQEPPGVGEHTVALMRELGYLDGQTQALREAKVLG